MSFILDALKKSETERQQQASAEFASVPTGESRPRRSVWLWILGVLLAINLAVMLGILFRPTEVDPVMTEVDALASAGQVASVAAPQPEPSFAEQVAVARESMPQVDPEPVSAVTNVREVDSQGTAAATARAEPGERLPTIDELRLDGRIELPELRIDIHVYSENPPERFVFINTVKHREKSVLPEGPAVREIRPDGVVLEHRGQVFLLPRQ